MSNNEGPFRSDTNSSSFDHLADARGAAAARGADEARGGNVVLYDARLKGRVGELTVAFKVGNAIVGDGALRPITYFPVTCAVARAPPLDPAAQQTLTALAPLRPVAAKWEETCSGAPLAAAATAAPNAAIGGTTTDRRYSEFVAFRSFLTRRNPAVVVPPLAAKSATDNVRTYRGNEEALRWQERQLSKFLSEVSFLPSLMTSPDLQKFCQLPREEFEKWYEGVAEYNRQQEASNGLITSVASAAGGVVRGVFTWLGVDASSSTATATQPNSVAAAVDNALAGDPTHTKWMAFEKQLLQLKEACDVAERASRLFVLEQAQLLAAVGEVGAAFKSLEGLLESSNSYGDLPLRLSEASTLELGIAESHAREDGKLSYHVCDALLHEAAWLQAGADTAVQMQLLLKEKATQTVTGEHPAGSLQRLAADAPRISEVLERNVLRLILYHQARMGTVLSSLSESTLHYLDQEELFCSHHPLPAVIRSTAYVSVCSPSASRTDLPSCTFDDRDSDEARRQRLDEAVRFFRQLASQPQPQ